MQKDLRTWIDKLEAAGDLHRIKAQVDWDLELSEVHLRNLRRGGPALLFENVKDHQETWCRKVLTNALTTFRRMAMALDLPADAPREVIVNELRQRFKNQVPPQMVASGPVKENIIRGKDIDLNQIPVPKWHELDAGRYINTWCATATRDPDTGVHNVGAYRGMIAGPDRINVSLSPAQNWGTHFFKCQRLGQPMPVAFIYGWDPSLMVAGGIHLTVPEYEIMGALMGEAVPLVKCETSDILVPASAEIVIEAHIGTDPASFGIEGPFGEDTGYYAHPRPRPVATVDCITHRNDPVFRGGVNEPYAMRTLSDAALIYNILETQDIPGIIDVQRSTFTVVKIHKTYQGQARHVAAALWGSRMAVTQLKFVVVVDDSRDVDIHDLAQVLRAIHFNVEPTRGILTFPMELGPPVDPALSADELYEMAYGQALQSKLLIDATVDWTAHPPNPAWGGRRISPECNQSPAQIVSLVEGRWQEYGL